MDLFYGDKYYVLLQDEDSLWVNRENGVFSTKSGRESVEQKKTLQLIGRIYGYIGTLRLSAAAEPRLVFVRSREIVCEIKGQEVYKITSILTVPLESECEVDVEGFATKARPESVNHASVVTSFTPVCSYGPQTVADTVTTVSVWNKVKISACPNSRKYGGRFDKTEKRLLDEFHKMFVEADSFYYSSGYDIFDSLQRQTWRCSEKDGNRCEEKDKNQNDKTFSFIVDEPLWKVADERFVWNQHMLSDITSSDDSYLHKWGVPIMQGSIQHQVCQLDSSLARVAQNDTQGPSDLELVLISRRSRYRAGTRYLKRGVDDQGKVANYVETEQIMVFRGHMIAFIQTRGSVPVFWSQPGYKYRPPVRLDKTVDESIPAFEKHITEELKLYGPLVLINLVENNGRERVLEEAYRKSVLTFNSEDLTYVTFDFHEKCRGLKFENVKLLTESVTDITKNMGFCWVDNFGVVMKQTGTFRVNCVDCLDRTNVVQSFLAKEVLTHQLSKVGLLMPEIGMSESIKKRFLETWANNGDIISKQYAGTNALKGDFTRTGERRFTGVMRDGMNSANRYLNNRLRDGTRQACVDIILGIRSNVTEEELLGKDAVDEKEIITTELVLQMIEDVKHCVLPENKEIIGSWGLVNGRTNEVGALDVDTVLILVSTECYVGIYDYSLDMISSTTKVPLNMVTSLEILNEPVAQHHASGMWGFFQNSGNNTNSPSHMPSLKLHFIAEDESKDYLHFRSSNIRVFNNSLTHLTHPDEMMENLKALAETIKLTGFANNKIIDISQSTPTVPVKSNQRGLGFNMWVPKWNNTSTPPVEGSSEPGTRKFSPASMQRFTPNFLKKKRPNTQAVEDEDTNRHQNTEMQNIEASVANHPLDPAIPQSLKIPTTLLTYSQEPSNFMFVSPDKAAMENISVTHAVDLYLPSCGLVSLHVRNIPSMHIGPILGCLSDDIKLSPGVSPVTPILSQDVTPTSNETNASYRLHIPPDLLQRHRFSLPTNSLGISAGLLKPGGRPTTPEIRITEEPNQTLTADLRIGSVKGQRRISRSSEDVNKVTSLSASVKMFNNAFKNKVPITLKNKLTPTLPQESRSTSDQDIFASLVNMKGSHSESAIKDGSPAQKRDVVFAPLGKFARGMQNIGVNYLDPRKIRDSLRQPKQDTVQQEDPELIEMMKTTKCRIIDV